MLFMWYSKTTCALVYPDFLIAFGFLEKFCPEQSRKLASHLENTQTGLSMKIMSGAYYKFHVAYGSDSKQSSMMCQQICLLSILFKAQFYLNYISSKSLFRFYLVTIDYVNLAVIIMHYIVLCHPQAIHL